MSENNFKKSHSDVFQCFVHPTVENPNMFVYNAAEKILLSELEPENV